MSCRTIPAPCSKFPRHFGKRIFGRLALLYGPREAEHWLPELERILKVHQAHKPPEMLEKEGHFDPRERFSQEHILLITYGDMVRGDGPTRFRLMGASG